MRMTPLNGDFDSLLRRALHAEADSVEPATDGLERILHRTREPWLLRQLSLMLTECADLFWLVVIRLEPGFSKLRQAIATRTGLLAAPAGRRHRPAGRRARAGARLAWIRPALAVSAAVVVVVAGVYGLAQLRQSLVLDLFPNAGVSGTTGPGAANGGQSGPSLQGHSTPGGFLPPGSGSASASPSPRATCERSPKEKPTPTPTTTPTPTPTGSPSGSPSPTPTTSPTATATGATTAAFVGTTSEVSLAGHCVRSSRSSPRTSAR
ncbi:MAG TPA: hypothetical protein VG123_12205 [Streptosporangiaceae bacterium]|nr:hypothetical protein [Streptosporangiaceae bacterium]